MNRNRNIENGNTENRNNTNNSSLFKAYNKLKKQQKLTNFLKNTDDINKENQKKQIEGKSLKERYLFVPPLLNQRHLFELTELCGTRNIGSNARLSQLYSRDISNLNADSIYRRNLHLIVNNQHLHRLPIGHSFNDNPNQQISHYNDIDYISSVKFDKMGSLFCSCSTNGKIGVFDFDNFLSKWNSKARIPYNQSIIKQQRENDAYFKNLVKMENIQDTVSDNDMPKEIKQGPIGSVSMDNIMLTSINTSFRIENIEWSDNLNDIAVCGHGGGCLNIYDLRRLNNKPKYKLRSTSKGHHPLLVNKYSNKNASISAMSLIAAGDRMGSVYCWDLNNKTSKPCLKFDAISKQTTLTGNVWGHNKNNMNMSHFAVKQLDISNDGILLYVVRENGFIEIMDIRKPGFIYKSIDLWRCPFKDANNSNQNNNNNNNKIYDNSLYSSTSTAHRARIDDAIILESMNCALLKLQNNSLVNVHFESGNIRKTYSFQEGDKPISSSLSQEPLINVDFLSKIMQRRMCSFEGYGMPEILVTGTFKNEMCAVDMSTELDAYYFERDYKQKRVDLGIMDNESLKYQTSSSFHSAKSELIKKEEYEKRESLHSKSYGLMGSVELSDIMTSCSLHPRSLYTVCGTLNNCLEIVSCASNPFFS